MILKVVGIAVLIIFASYCAWRLMKTSSDSEDIEERLFQEYLDKRNKDNQMTVLSDLEKQTFEKLKSELVEDFKYLS